MASEAQQSCVHGRQLNASDEAARLDLLRFWQSAGPVALETLRLTYATKTVQPRSALMTSFKQPSFQDRVGQAAGAKEKALEQLRLRPEPDEKIAAQRKAVAARRQAAQAEKSAEKKEVALAAAQSKARAAAKAAAPIPTEAERKAARDARYAARKSRK